MTDVWLRLLLETGVFGRYFTHTLESVTGGSRTPASNHGVIVCCLLKLESEQRVNSLARGTGVTSGRVTQVVGELSELGLVSTRSDPSDGRATLVSLTDQGHAFLHDAGVALQKAFSEDPEPAKRYIDALRAAMPDAAD